MRRLFILLVLTACGLGCRTAAYESRQELALFERALQLSISPAETRLLPGQNLDIRFRITNTSNQALRTCLGSLQGVTFWGLDQRYAKSIFGGPIVDHPGCEEELSLAAGGTHEWIQTVTVPDVPPGAAQIFGSVQLVSERNCDQYGCDTMSLRASHKTVSIDSPSN
jgi:hypothetical protein